MLVPKVAAHLGLAVGSGAIYVPDRNKPQLSFVDRRNQILNAFEANIEPVKTVSAYKLKALLVTAVMAALPMVYIGFIGLVGLAVLYHLTHHGGMVTAVRGRAAIFALLLYLAPIVIGGITVIFMFKPLFARGVNDRRSRALTRDGEPLLFAFVDRLAEAVGAPAPNRIEVDSDVNASASFRRGWLSVLLGGDLTLTIGVPLVAGLTMRQFAGVLAHEFGHFSQGAGMRLSYIIRVINHWLTRVVYERDTWDVWLEESTANLDPRVSWIFGLAQIGVMISRALLWVLMMVGHAVSGMLLREMEFDADRHEARLAGSEEFTTTMTRIIELSVANEKTMHDLYEYFQSGQLGDNMPKLLVYNSLTLPDSLMKKVHEKTAATETELFDTHPCFKDRVANAMKEQAVGVFRLEVPASELFVHFDALCRNVTSDMYRDLLRAHVMPEHMQPIDGLITALQKQAPPSWE
ncbi:MAG: M48 family metalloprotease [Planctomycetaceae bacterium]|nr:M48 family metalloprotease [Planctomycetales bacterium]MCB9923211.1 M48 family metalloprotease [Planctomycetaceae bacterium]